MSPDPVRPRPGMRWWFVPLLGAIALGLALALVVDVVRFGGIDGWLVAHRLPGLYWPFGRSVAVGETDVYVDCRGSGGTTVILDSGLGTGAAGWGLVLDRSAGITRTCTWDRPGIGRTGSIGPHSATDTAALLRDALEAAGERGPFVAVGHSLGGVYARIFSAQFRAEMVGTVLVDPYLPDVHPVEHVDMDPSLRSSWLAGLDQTNRWIEDTEQLDWPATAAELAAADLGDLPLELLFVEQRFRWEGAFEPYEAQLIAAWEPLVLGLSTDSRLTIAVNSTHMIQWDKPDLVVDAIRRIVERADDG